MKSETVEVLYKGLAYSPRNLLLAYHDSIRVYATSTSLLLRSLRTRKGTIVSSFHLSQQDPSQLYISYKNGQIQLWDWHEGNLIQTWDLSSKVLDSTAFKAAGSDILLTVDRVRSTQKWTISAHHLPDMTGVEESSQKTLYRTDQPIFNLWVSDDGRSVVATGKERIVIGFRQNQKSPLVKGLNYKWWEFSALSGIISFDVQQLGPSTTGNPAPPVNLVIGCHDGTVQYYLDVVNKMFEIEKMRRVTTPPNTRLRWHRDLVGAVKWSRDGNYLVSGGMETVLVLWQLDTGARNFLPHLSSAIVNLVISPNGASYAVQLADNSCMVISTRELQPEVNIPGIVLPTSNGIPQPHSTSHIVSRRPAVAVSNIRPPQILLAIPTGSKNEKNPKQSSSASYLQTIDARSGTQLARQALTRTKITDRNIGPDGFVIDDPNVVLLQVSSDGKSLATVEEWYPPKRDIEAVEGDSADLLANQVDRLETCLRFWTLNEESSVWELVSRIDKPHSATKEMIRSNGVVLDLASNPSSVGFITLGDDLALRIWKPKLRYRNNVPVKDVQGRSLTNWGCHKTIHLSHTSSTFGPESSQISISQDGSIIVVGQSNVADSIIYLINSRSSQILTIRADMFSGTLRDIGVLDRSLIILADDLLVWDLVNDQLSWVLKLKECFSRSYGSHLAVNSVSNSFVVTLPEMQERRGPKTRVAVFRPDSPNPLYTTEIRGMVVATVSSPQTKGFLALDRTAQIHAITQSHQVQVFTEVEPESKESDEEESTVQGLDAIYGNALKDGHEESQPPASRLLLSSAQQSNFVRQQQLSELFDHTQPFALPPVTNLFEQVAGLVAGAKVKEA